MGQIAPRSADLTPERAVAHERMHPANPSLSADSPYSRPPVGIQEPESGALKPTPPTPPLPPTEPTAKSKPTWAVVVEWVILIVCALTIALLIKTFLFQAFYIPSDSMVPTLKTNDRVIVNKLSYKLHPVHRGDIVVFTTPKDANGNPIDPTIKDLVKRVIGLPGETVSEKDGHILLNGKPIDESYLP